MKKIEKKQKNRYKDENEKDREEEIKTNEKPRIKRGS